jgi:NADH:ubiquinone oxidoreductase subunit 5 (subunit L)/multisubunit Na+/H+ antiporter MnhA subunit
MLVNQVGDFGLALGIMGSFYYFSNSLWTTCFAYILLLKGSSNQSKKEATSADKAQANS